MPRPTFATYTFTGIPAESNGVGYYTTTQTGSAVSIGVTHDVNGLDQHLGWMEKGLLLVEQTAAGAGNTAGKYFEITVQTARTSSGPWLTIPQTTQIRLTTNAATQYGSTFDGPLSGYIRVVATAVNNPQAQFTVYVICGG